MDPEILEILKVVILAMILLGIVVFAVWYICTLRNRKNNSIIPPVEKKDGDVLVSVKLQACERLILFLERIRPNNLILRVHTADMTTTQLQSALIRTIREEFEYNQSQQLYLATSTWEMIRNAKEDTVRLINQAASGMKEDATSRELAGAILQLSLEQEPSPVAQAIEAVKKEIRG